MPDVTDPLLNLVRRRREPVVTQTARSTVAAVIAYVVALQLSSEPAPLTAPLTALLVTQVTLYTTLKTGMRRVNAVVAGVLISTGFSSLVGLTWWSLGIVILAALIIGRFVKAGEFVPETAISAMLVLGVSQVAAMAWDRVLETLVGAVVGLSFNVLFVPPVWVQPASEAVIDLSGRMRRLLLSLGEQVRGHIPVTRAAERLHEARQLDQDIEQVDADLRRAEDSLRLNPRVKEGMLSRVVLRTGLDTMEICAVVLRTVCRTLVDLAKARTEEPLFAPHIAEGLHELFTHMARAIESFAVLITTQVSTNADEAESRLVRELDASRTSRDTVAHRLLDGVQEHPRQWQLHGALLAEVDRILDELDVEKRSQRLWEELDRQSREQRDRYRMLRKSLGWRPRRDNGREKDEWAEAD
ncbi:MULTISPECIES: FUSC family protein [unclassified Streptomyces]|uniref:FUSC family protein n=1 Tax=unclassified Streptomyces TaxID=2593676 RepID=UPI002DD7FD4E|nr:MULTISPECIES: FUSC family protein [unclassified Streptomyces]WSA93736.1 aromatic acid exporter family protein [Streptomyces sp. NBC_01795]WSB78107.1 aromatic acid exporter family protein [Streptomyces sp. NBC_01775]WSS13641.1 aromatic acid exporter family protein [Streptomyces sp. NBC_01186]WSS42437.1 aromatic acid exporter family protein [Streptomyces sp. NBC_01187]